MKTISFEDLMTVIERSKKRMDILVPSQDFYARAGDFSTETISYIDAEDMLDLLQQFMNFDRS